MKKYIIIIAIIFFTLFSGWVIYLNFFAGTYNKVRFMFSCSEAGKAIGAQGLPEKCCAGLKPMVGQGGYKDDCPEPPIVGGLQVCNPCGNGFCDIKYNENKCNCPEDCK